MPHRNNSEQTACMSQNRFFGGLPRGTSQLRVLAPLLVVGESASDMTEIRKTSPLKGAKMGRILGAHVSRRSPTLHGPTGIDGFASMRLLSLLFRRASPPPPPC